MCEREIDSKSSQNDDIPGDKNIDLGNPECGSPLGVNGWPG